MNNNKALFFSPLLDRLAAIKLNKKTALLLFVLLSIVMLAAATYPSIRSEMAARIGETYKFKTVAFDPADPFRGRYLQFALNTSTVDKASERALFPDQYTSYGKPCYLTIQVAEDGIAYFDKVLAEPPTDGSDYLKARYQYGSYDLPIGHYYVDENVAPAAEKAFFENPDNCFIILKVEKGTSVVTGMYLGELLIDDVEF